MRRRQVGHVLSSVGACVVFALGVAGCSSPAPVVEPPAPVQSVERVLPTYAKLAAAQNARAASLDRIWAAATALVTYEDQGGQIRTEQAEGYLQLIQPMQVALSLGKQVTSDVYFYLGSNQTHYWWFDRLDPDQKVAFIGTHELATPERAARFGAPVHPLDLLDLLGITPLPEAAVVRGGTSARSAPASPTPPGATSAGPGPDRTLPPGARVDWSPDGANVLVQVPGRFGTRRMWFDPATLMPRRVEILDDRGRVVVFSSLEHDVLVPVRGDSRVRPMMAENVSMEIPGTPISVRLRLDRIENKRDQQRAAPFDLDRLLQAYPVGRVEDIDEWEAGSPEGDRAGVPSDSPAGSGDEGPDASSENTTGPRQPDRRLRIAPGGRPRSGS